MPALGAESYMLAVTFLLGQSGLSGPLASPLPVQVAGCCIQPSIIITPKLTAMVDAGCPLRGQASSSVLLPLSLSVLPTVLSGCSGPVLQVRKSRQKSDAGPRSSNHWIEPG